MRGGRLDDSRAWGVVELRWHHHQDHHSGEVQLAGRRRRSEVGCEPPAAVAEGEGEAEMEYLSRTLPK